MKRFLRIGILAGMLLWGVGLLRWPQEAAASAREGLSLCANVIIPSLFPFFVLASLVVSLGLAQELGRVLGPIMGPVFGVSGPGGTALAVGLLAGYPVGAQTVRELYEAGHCDQDEAETLLAFCNNCGPAFLLGTAGAGVFGSGQAGLLLLLCHWLGAVSVGIFFRFRRGGRVQFVPHLVPPQPISFFQAFTGAVKSALLSTLNVCAYVVLFSVILTLLRLGGVLGLLTQGLTALGLVTAEGVVTGFVELSNGVATLTTGGSLLARLATASFVLGFGGLSVQCQTMAVLAGSGLSVRREFFGKCLHGLFAALWTGLLGLFPGAVPAFAPAVHPNVVALLWQPVATLLLSCVVLAVLLRILWKKGAGKHPSNGV